MYNVNMLVKFIWDDIKDKENQKKHGVSFTEAVTIFRHLPLEIYYDPDHSSGEEDRYIAVGFNEQGRVLIVVHCENTKSNKIRIISARKATRREQRSVFGAKPK